MGSSAKKAALDITATRLLKCMLSFSYKRQQSVETWNAFTYYMGFRFTISNQPIPIMYVMEIRISIMYTMENNYVNNENKFYFTYVKFELFELHLS